MSNIADNLRNIKERIRFYEQKYDRKKNSVTLLPVSKKQSVTKIEAAYKAGERAFAESFVQEALEKMNSLTHLQDGMIEWHFIGSIQSNKTKKIAEHFTWVHSLADRHIAKRLNEQRSAELPPLSVCIEVNVSREKSKSGIRLEDVWSFAQDCLALPRLRLRGLMAIPEPTSQFQKQRDAFHLLYEKWLLLREQGIDLDTLSMGMSHDFEAAICEGSTLVRLGTSVFGPRGS